MQVASTLGGGIKKSLYTYLHLFQDKLYMQEAENTALLLQQSRRAFLFYGIAPKSSL